MEDSNIRVGNIEDNRGEINIAGRDVHRGYTAEQVSVLIAQIRTTFQPRSFDGKCPYKGLDVFDEQDADLFFGRERLVEELVRRVRESRNLFITGPSGSGKSSLARAGLIHSLRCGALGDKASERWVYSTIRPGRNPTEALAEAFGRLKTPDLAKYFLEHVNELSILNACAESVLSESASQRFVLFIDQFEEAFTQIPAEREEVRQGFFQVLTDAADVENGRVILVFSMRSDFVSTCADYPRLNKLLNQPAAFAQIGAMQPDELVSAIAQPALRVGLQIDPDLVSQVIKDMGGEPGALPLMQFALKDLFDAEQAKGGVIALTRAAYLARGGIHKSLERHADHSFQQLSEGEQELARSIFSGLVEIGRGTPDTGRTALFEELIPANAKAENVKVIIEKLADARLITTDELSGRDRVTISHERLIDAWPWLRKLVNENRDVIALQNEIAGDAKDWDEHGRDVSYLYRGAKLTTAQEKLEAKKLVLSGLSQAFLAAGIKAHTDEVEAIKQRATQLRRRNVILSVALVFALVAGGIAIFFGLRARQQAQVAFARQLAAQAVVLQSDKRDLALLMSVRAHKLNDEFETRSSLLSALQCCSDALIAFMSGHTDSVWDVAFSPDGKTLASSGTDGMILLWDVQKRKQVGQVPRENSTTVYAVAFSPDGKLLAAGDGTGLITLYDAKSWQPVGEPLRKHESSVLSLKFSLDGHWLVSGGTDGLVLVWDVPKRELYRTFEGHGNWIWDVAISADSRAVASVGRPATSGAPTLFLWSLAEDSSIEDVGVPAGTLVSVAFNENPNSQMLVTGDPSGKVLVWNLIPWRYRHQAPVPSNKIEVGASSTSAVWGLAFVPGEPFQIVTGRDIGILNRNRINPHHNPSKITLSRETLGVTGNNFGFFRIDVSPDGTLVAAAGQDGLVSLWHASEMSGVLRHSARVTNVQILDGNDGLVVSIDENGGLYRSDYTRQKILTELSLDTGEVLRSAIHPDGSRAVTGYNDGKILFWDAGTGEQLAEHKDHTARITSLVFDRDGKRLASSDANGHVVLWEVTAKTLKPLSSFDDPQKSAVQVLRFSPDGGTLAGGGCGVPILFPAPECSQGAIYVWDVSSELKLRHQPLPGKSGFVWSMAFNPNNPEELAVGTRDGTVTVWNLGTRKPGLSFRVGESDIASLAFSPDGQLLAVGADSYRVFLYNAHTGQMFGQSFREHDGSTTALVFSPDGETLMSASIDSTIVLHDMRIAKWEEHACRLANRNLLRAEWDLYIGAALPYDEICPGFPLEPEPTATP